MSLLLEVALFIRKNLKSIKLSVTERLLLFTLASRIGKNQNTWISQAELSEEMQISKRHLIRALNTLRENDILLVKKKWRSNHYSLSKEQLLRCHPCHLTMELSSDIDVTLKVDQVTPMSPLECHPCHLITPENTSQDIETTEEKTEKNPPKVTMKVTIKANKQSITPNIMSRFDDFWKEYPCKEGSKKKAKDIWSRKKLDLKADMIIADVIKRKSCHKRWLDGYVPYPTTYLNGERWEDEITEVINAEGRTVSQLSPHQASLKRGWDVIKDGNWH